MGDLVQIPLANDIAMLGQIIDFPRGDKRVILLVLYPRTFAPADLDSILPDILAEPPALEAITFDIQLKEGRWAVVGNRPLPAGYAPSLFKAVTPKGYVAMDHHLNIVRDPPGINIKQLRLRTTSDGRIIERVGRALAGLEPWISDYDDYRIPGTISGHQPRYRLPWRRRGS